MTAGVIPVAGDITAFTQYLPASGAATDLEDIGSKMRPNSYAGLTSADPDLGYGSVQFYFIHRKTDGDYLAHIVPGSGTSSAVTDLKPMSQPGGPSTGGDTGYFALTFAASDLGDGANLFYYLRTDAVTGATVFGSLVPALSGTSTDIASLSETGHNALTYTTTEVGYGTDQMYFLRLDSVTGFTILGTLDPQTGRSEDIANLGSVFSALTFVVGDVSFGTNHFYTTGFFNPTWQSVSFAAIADRALVDGGFTVRPTASSGLPIVLTVVAGSVGEATITGPVGGVFTVTPTKSGRIILQATQAGQTLPVAYEYNMLRQAFNVDFAGDPTDPTDPTDPIDPQGPTGPIDPSKILPLLSDFNRDGQSDIVWRDVEAGTAGIWMMDGTDSKRRRTIARNLDRSAKIEAVGDFNGDGHSDLLWRDARTGKITLWIMRGARVRAEREIRTRTPRSMQIRAAGDFNADGRTDVLWQRRGGKMVGVWMVKLNKRFATRRIAPGITGWRVAGTGDFNADGNVDVLHQNFGTGEIGVWFMSRMTVKATGTVPGGTRPWRLTGTGDFNRDGQLDLILNNRNGGRFMTTQMDGTEQGSDSMLAKRRRPWEIVN